MTSVVKHPFTAGRTCPTVTSRCLILSVPKQFFKKKGEKKNFQWMCLIVEIVSEESGLTSFIFWCYIFFAPHWSSANLQTKRLGDFLAAAQSDAPGSWPSCTAGKGITGLSAKAIPMYLCTTACTAVQRRGNLVKSLGTGKYPFYECERTICKYNTGCSACHASSRCQTCIISFL